MKKYRVLLIISIILALSTIILLINNTMKVTVATDCSDINDITIAGTVTDANGDPISNLTVSLIDTSNNNNNKTTNTDDKGKYSFYTQTGNYRIEFDDQNGKYKVKQIIENKYELAQQNIEMAFIHDSSVNINNLKNKMVEEGKKLYIIDKEFDFATGSNLDLLQVIGDETTFQKTKNEGWTSIGVILTNKNPTSIKNDFLAEYETRSDYKWVIVGKDAQIVDVFNSGNSNINFGDDLGIKLTEKSKSDNSESLDLNDVNSVETVDCTVEEEKNGELTLSRRHPNAITVFFDINNNNFSDGNGKIRVILQKVGYNNKYNFQDIDLATYRNNTRVTPSITFGYPGSGEYNIKFEFCNKKELNGQYYELDSLKKEQYYYSPDPQNYSTFGTTNVLYNKDTIINYDMEGKIDENNGDICNLEITTASFRINSSHQKTKIKLKMKKREPFKLSVKNEVNAYKLTLSNGQNFVYKNKDELSDVYNIVNLDRKLCYGAKLYIEYKITLRNDSSYTCNDCTILSRLNLEYEEDVKRLSGDEKNSDFGWKLITNDDVGNLTSTKDDEGGITYYVKSEKNITVNPHSETELYLVGTWKLDSKMDYDCNFKSTAEIIAYKNDGGRRNYYTDNNSNDVFAKAGNYNKDNGIHVNEADTSTSHIVSVVPPTGNR